MNDDDTFTISIGDGTYEANTSTIDTIDLSNITVSTHPNEYTFSNCYNVTFDTNSSSEYIYNALDTFIDPDEVELMCKEYPALTKVWRNFKSIYDMTLQDWKGKKVTDGSTPI